MALLNVQPIAPQNRVPEREAVKLSVVPAASPLKEISAAPTNKAELRRSTIEAPSPSKSIFEQGPVHILSKSGPQHAFVSTRVDADFKSAAWLGMKPNGHLGSLADAAKDMGYIA